MKSLKQRSSLISSDRQTETFIVDIENIIMIIHVTYSRGSKLIPKNL
jgi:hypothetical protein